MVNCEVLTGKYPELLPRDWTRCHRVSPLHELSCSFVERTLMRTATVAPVLIETPRDTCSDCGWRILLTFSGSRRHHPVSESCSSGVQSLTRKLQRNVVLRCPARHDAVGWWRVLTAEDRVLQLHQLSCSYIERCPLRDATVVRELKVETPRLTE